MDWASLYVGMTTETRTDSDWKLRPAPRDRDVDCSALTRGSESQRDRYGHRDQQLPYPAESPLRNPQPSQQSKCDERGRSGKETEDERHSEARFKNSLQ